MSIREENGHDVISDLRSGFVGKEKIDEMRLAVLNQDCPFCGMGGFKSIAGHIWNRHGVLSRDLRDMLLITYTESICSADTSEKMRLKSLGRNPREKKTPDFSSRVYSKKGCVNVRKNLTPYFKKASKNVLEELGRKVGLSNKGNPYIRSTTTHGTRAMFRRGCKCELCDSANKSYWVNYNKKRKP